MLYLILREIARIEGKEAVFKSFFKGEKAEKPEKVITSELVITLVIEVGVMVCAGALVGLLKAYS